MLVSAVIGLVFVIGCGGSEEKHKMSDFIQEYSKTIDEYSDAVDKADTAKKAEIEGKIKSYASKWSDMKMQLEDQITPQALDEFEKEYHKITQKYKALAEKS
jgi:hypothetical protein